jgi:putative addiction module component (TIGR02574 family)
MSTPVVQRLEAAVLSLPLAERARLAERLIASLDEPTEIEEAWAVEVKRRLDALDRGEIELIPTEQVMEEARRRIGG